eukprot:EG_transcript_5777
MASQPPLAVVGPPLKSFQTLCNAPGSVVAYDELTDCVVVVHGAAVHLCPVRPAKPVDRPHPAPLSYHVGGVDALLAAKRNREGTVLAALHTEARLLFCGVGRLGGPEGAAGPPVAYEVRLGLVPYLRNTDQANAVKGFFWVDGTHLLVVTHVRVDLLEVQLDRGQVTKVSGMNATPDAWHYNSDTRQLLLLNLRKRTRLRLLHVTGQSVTEVRIVPLDAPCSGTCVVRALRYRGQTLLLLCDAGHRVATGWLTSHDSTAPVRRFFTADLPNVPGDYAISLVDNCLALHHLAAKCSHLFDVPLPSQCATAPHLLESLAAVPLQATGAADRTDWYAAGEVSYHQPNLVLDPQHGCLHELTISIPAILAVHPRRDKPLSVALFLLKRVGGLQPFEEQLWEWLRKATPLPELAEVFRRINAGYAQVHGHRLPSPPTPTSFYVVDSFDRDTLSSDGRARGGDSAEGPSSVGRIAEGDADSPPPAAIFPGDGEEDPGSPGRLGDAGTTTDGFIVPNQDRLVAAVFQPLRLEGRCPPRHFLAAAVEYCRSLEAAAPGPDVRVAGLPLQDMIVDLLVEAKPPDYHRLHQFIQFRVIDDQVATAHKLLKLESAYAPSFQLALDMLSRLKEWEEITNLLMARGRMVQAVELLIR